MHRKKNRGGSSRAATTIKQLVVQILLILSAFVWVLAVIKVFLLEGTRTKIGPVEVNSNEMQQQLQQHQPIIRKESTRRYKSRIVENPALVANKEHVVIPTASEWAFVRASPAYKMAMEDGTTRKPIVPFHAQKQSKEHTQTLGNELIRTNSKSAYELTWPPVQPDGSISPSDGVDVMPILGIKVPRFWEPQSNADMNKVGFEVNGQETIFLMIASYRDFQCRETITSAYARSDHPERLYVGAVDQTVPGDTGCFDLEIPCTVNSDQPMCIYRDQISIFPVDASMATGPVTARHIGDRMYRGQTFVMQMDAHCLFVRQWDTQIIEQWKQTHNEMAVLSSYLTDTKGSFTSEGTN